MPQSREESTLHKEGEKVPMETSGPYREELEPQINAEVAGEGAPNDPRPNREGTLGNKEEPTYTGTNPKRTDNSRPE